jgi:hypothetical protein
VVPGAGALATAVALKQREPRIFTYLLDLSAASLPGPLAAYQSTVATMEDTLRLVNSLLSYLGVEPKDPDRALEAARRELELVRAAKRWRSPRTPRRRPRRRR